MDTPNSGEYTVSKHETIAPLSEVQELRGELLVVQIESKYYVGWGKYIQNSVRGAVVTYNHSANRVTAKFGQAEINSSFDGLKASGNITVSAGGCIDSHVEVGGTVSDSGSCGMSGSGITGPITHEMPDANPLDLPIESYIRRTEDEDIPLNSWLTDPRNRSVTLDAGTYHIDEDVDTSSTLKLNVNAGDVTLVVDGNMTFDGGGTISVTGTSGNNHRVNVYQDGDFAAGTAAKVNPSNPADRFILYGTSDLKASFARTAGIHMGIYAPRNTIDHVRNHAATSRTIPDCVNNSVCLGTGAASFEGGIVTGGVEVGTGAEFTWDSSLAGLSPSIQGVVPPDLTFAHLSVHNVTVRGNT
jgi:hypothetical protein